MDNIKKNRFEIKEEINKAKVESEELREETKPMKGQLTFVKTTYKETIKVYDY